MNRLKRVVKKIPEHKPYFEAIGAILSIPVLITVILLNLNNLNQNKNSKTVTPSPTPAKEIIIHDIPINVTSQPNNTSNANSLSPTPAPTSAVCNKSVGSISISSPSEGATVTNNPVCLTIQPDPNSCSVVWSYRINGGNWSNYSGNSPCLYNMPNGNVKFDLQVQSTVSQDQTTLTRNFNYQGSTISPIPTPAPTGSQ